MIGVSVSAALIWIVSGFVVLDWNLFAWSEGSRAALVMLSLMSGCMFMVAEI